ncbi:MAG TPA: polysaccharide deacetylase family protein [Candidatus Polarisedimenticolaceae bacterium]|nr:polysaccharide deacetylase family protein [Candidatus Polarisedimenticolaceae bacterium]
MGPPIPRWRWSSLTTPTEVFADHLEWLTRAGYATVDLERLHRHVAGQASLPPKSVVLTFDDGYLDNWAFVAPLLEKYGCTGTVFVSTEFVDTRDVVRPTLSDVWSGHTTESVLQNRGFMSWEELRRVSERGTLSVQSHLTTHTWYPVGPKIVDFHRPGDGHYWLDWNVAPRQKSLYLEDPERSVVPWGSPVYENAKAIVARRYIPGPGEQEALAEFVHARGDERFFDSPDWNAQLSECLTQFRRQHGISDVFESDHDRLARQTAELADSKTKIETQVGKAVNYLCWPGGGYDDRLRVLAREYYRASSLSSHDQPELRNRPGEDPGAIRRWGAPEIGTEPHIEHLGGRYLTAYLDEFRGVPLARPYRRILKLRSLFSRMASQKGTG